MEIFKVTTAKKQAVALREATNYGDLPKLLLLARDAKPSLAAYYRLLESVLLARMFPC
ncbi:hypothetical protein J6590_086615 [Homalodisca vitripennis]|nr:hypothetical protein J6590_086615 [Homalodisca vitripennis]